MAGFLRGRQAGIQRDLSAGLEPELFAIDKVPNTPRDAWCTLDLTSASC